jgi:hypothetical protein
MTTMSVKKMKVTDVPAATKNVIITVAKGVVVQ